MSKLKLNSESVLAGKLVSGGEDSHSISSRKIDNGYIVSSHSYNSRTGECKSSERFVEGEPRLVPGKEFGITSSVKNPLRGAVDYLK
jgi:hypothetical protein